MSQTVTASLIRTINRAVVLDFIRQSGPVPRLVASPLGRRAAVMGAIMLVLNATTEHFVVRRLR